jgi:uncharacterized protein YaaN involved in tellurite resistance
LPEKAQSICFLDASLENQLTLAVACKDKSKILKSSVKVSETTNTILQKNAEMLKQE